MLIIMAGLPGSGKSRIATEISAALDGIVLDKDRLRAALFPPKAIEYSTSQDDFCMQLLYQTAAYLLENNPQRTVIIDGRPFAHAYQVNDLAFFFHTRGIPYRLIECVCSDEIARQRLEQDLAQSAHRATNRDYRLYLELKRRWMPIPPPKLVLDTGRPLKECLADCLAFLRSAD